MRTERHEDRSDEALRIWPNVMSNISFATRFALRCRCRLLIANTAVTPSIKQLTLGLALLLTAQTHQLHEARSWMGASRGAEQGL